jgi:hypothetical protein
MRCTRVEKFLPLYVAGDLAGRRAGRRVTNHLATCERCRGAAEEYEASRNLLRVAATLPPDFDGAFYEELRRSVLTEIKREHTRLAPPARIASLFNARFAYAASLAFLLAVVAALSLHSYVGRTSVDTAPPQKHMIADTNHERSGTTEATPVSTQAKEGGRQTLSPLVETTRENKKHGSQVAQLSSSQRRANNGRAQNETQRSVNSLKHTASYAKRNPLAPVVAATAENKEQIASINVATDAVPEVSRIEIQTADPNIRIIWLSPKPDATEQPLK